MGIKKPKSKSILKEQPLYRKKIRRTLSLLLVAVISATSIAFCLKELCGILITNNLPIARVIPILVPEGFNQIPSITNLIQEKIERRQNLSAICQSIFNKFPRVKTISIRKIETDLITYHIELKKPFATLDPINQLQITETGKVYRGPNPSETLSMPLFKPNTLAFRSRRNSIPLEKNQEKIIFNAINLYKIAKKSNISVNEIKYIEHRGFQMTLPSSQYTVQIGHPPFARRVEKLRSIIIKLKRRGISNSHIEIDFNNKAFVKKV